MHNYLKKKINYNDIYVNTSLSKNYYRKPNPGMIKEVIKKHNIDVSSSIFIGDRKIDIDCQKKR